MASAACPHPAGDVQPPVTRPVLVARKRGLHSLGSPAGDSAFDRQVDTTLPSLSEHRNERQESCASRPGSSAESEDYRDDSYEAQCDHCASSEEEEEEEDRDEQEQEKDRDEQEKDRDDQEEDRDEQEQEESNDDTAEEQESDDEKQQASLVEEQETAEGKQATSAEEQVSNVETRRFY